MSLEPESRAKRRAERIRREIPIVRVLALYGFPVRSDLGDREQQFSCSLHGNGTDARPSARVYPEGGQWYCWACSKSRDAISTVREKEGLDFYAAVTKLETHYGLPPLPWEEGDSERAESERFDFLDAPKRSLDEEFARVSSSLYGLTVERALSLRETAGFWEELDRAKTIGDEREALEILETLRDRVRFAAYRAAGS